MLHLKAAVLCCSCFFFYLFGIILHFGAPNVIEIPYVTTFSTKNDQKDTNRLAIIVLANFYLFFFPADIDGQQRETYEIERSISNMQNDLIKLNKLLHKEKGTQVMLQQENILKENDFITSLKVCWIQQG